MPVVSDKQALGLPLLTLDLQVGSVPTRIPSQKVSVMYTILTEQERKRVGRTADDVIWHPLLMRNLQERL